MNWISEKTGKLLADYLNEPSGKYETYSTAQPDMLCRCLQKGDVLLIDGHLRVSVAIKYITQSTRAICSTLIAQAFQLVAYPILPVIKSETVAGSHYTRECLHIRHHSLFTPRDFDVSPYFEIIKPTLAEGFDYKALNWVSDRPEHRPLNTTAVAQ